MSEYDPHEAINFIFKTAPAFAKAKGELAQLENFKHSLRAIKMSQSLESSLGGQEKEALRSQDYQDLCKAIGAATEQTEALKWQLEAAKMRFQAWQTESANNRQLEKFTV
jgi:hypothetical protein